MRKIALAGASHFIVISAGGANAKSIFFYNRVKGEMEKAVSELGFSSVDIFRPSILVGKRNETRILENFGEHFLTSLQPIFRFMFKKYAPISAEKVAQAIIQCSKQNLQGGIRVHEFY